MSFYRKIYRMDITLRSPLSIGSGSDENTDKDVIVDNCGEPFIPASSLAGVLRARVAGTDGVLTANMIFGYTPDSREANEKAKAGVPEYIERECLVRVYDGLLSDRDGGAFFITNRDMVALENKVGIDGAKFDMQAVETGARFRAFIELLDKKPLEAPDIDIARLIEEALSAMDAGEVRLGTKTSRGYGEVSLEVRSREFSDAGEWIDFDMTDDGAWNGTDPVTLRCGEGKKLVIGLRLKGGISIREYTTEPSTEKETMPDYKQLSLHDENRTPVIPGTSWAGAFRDRFIEFSVGGKEAAKELFGFVKQEKKGETPENSGKDDVKAKKSIIVFSESRLDGGVVKRTTRNAIDRFTGGTKDGALYTEETYCGGTTDLTISFRGEPTGSQLGVLCACLADLHNGFLAVGGLTSVGRGLFEITGVNGRELTEEERRPEKIFEVLKKEAGPNE